MARKSKETMLTSRLQEVSGCPLDLFRRVTDPEHMLWLAMRAEENDVDAIIEAASVLSSLYLPTGEYCEALGYLISKGVALKSRICAEYAVKHTLATYRDFDTAVRAIGLLGEGECDNELLCAIDEVKAMITVAAVADDGLHSYCDELSVERHGLVLLYARAASGGSELESLCERMGLARLHTLPSLTGADAPGPSGELSEDALGIMTDALGIYPDPLWRDFWLRCIYESVAMQPNGDLEGIAETVIAAAEWREYSASRALHVLAWYEYLALCHPDCNEYRLKCDELRERCRFEGLDPMLDDEARKKYMLEAVYLSSKDEMHAEKTKKLLGAVIEHRKNRFTLTLNLDGRGKHARMHCWRTVISMRTERSTPPTFPTVTDFEVRIAPTRGGVTLERDRSTCQIIARSELNTDDIRHPFELDIYADIAYISATKCSTLIISPVGSRRDGEYLIMDCEVYLR